MNNNNTCDSRAFVAASEEPTFSRPTAEIICSSHGMHTSFSPPSINNNIPEKRKPTPTTAHAQDHVLAERKRREKLSQRFIALSALLPGLKKMDKASVLGDAIKYIKQVEERVRVLEEKAKKRSIESAILVNKSHLYNDCDEEISRFSDQKQLPEIEARISDDKNNVLVRIHCEKNEGLFAKLLGEMEKMNLTIVNANFFPFGTSTQYMVLVAQIDSELKIKSKEKNPNGWQAAGDRTIHSCQCPIKGKWNPKRKQSKRG
ncbi:transcription factor bHLH18-like isoform X4 [Momordica charantia]|uniref:Transcription factor bHLH18-like isoform X4 n=1 Tax=Momordica charantia TaxID=3673 RepID=A0A6J1C590_MOMCH|nr:transcription factor bHLH18-like isoform X4 [Momordica charantia]